MIKYYCRYDKIVFVSFIIIFFYKYGFFFVSDVNIYILYFIIYIYILFSVEMYM